MRFYIPLIFIFAPLILSSQELKCGNSILVIEQCLTGDWKVQNSVDNKIYSFEFKEGNGHFLVYALKDDGSLSTLSETNPEIKILKSNLGFEIEFNYGSLKVHNGIAYLDPNKLILKRRDGAERIFRRIINSD